MRVEDLRQLAVMVFHSVAFVNDHVLPTDLRGQEQAVRGAGRPPPWLEFPPCTRQVSRWNGIFR